MQVKYCTLCISGAGWILGMDFDVLKGDLLVNDELGEGGQMKGGGGEG